MQIICTVGIVYVITLSTIVASGKINATASYVALLSFLEQSLYAISKQLIKWVIIRLQKLQPFRKRIH